MSEFDKQKNTFMFDEDEQFYVDVHCQQRNHFGELICGDVFRSKRIKTENRLIIVLSDGMGHGVKANVLATLTASLAVNFTEEHKDFEKIADIIMNTLPVCAERKISYSTFTIVDIDLNGQAKIMEYDNPHAIVIHNSDLKDVKWSTLEMSTEKNKGKKLHVTNFNPKKGDRIIFCSDGVTQSGLGTKLYPSGWGITDCTDYVLKMLSNNDNLSASAVSLKIVNQAFKNDDYSAQDDISCASIYFRSPRKCLICTGPPFDKSQDKEYAKNVGNFNGKKIISGGTSAEIISRELHLPIKKSMDLSSDHELPPISFIEGFELVTEGVLTLNKVFRILTDYHNLNFKLGKGPADKIVSIMLDSDVVCFQVGTNINIAHQDPTVPIELELRRTIINRIARVLEESFLKDVKIKYL